MPKLYEILFRFRADTGALAGAHAKHFEGDRPGPARPLSPTDIEALGGFVAEAYETRIRELTTELAALRESHAAELASLRENYATTKARPESAEALAALSAAYDTLPAEAQVAFTGDFAAVRGLVEAGRRDLARAHVAKLAIPAELDAAGDAIVGIRDAIVGILAD